MERQSHSPFVITRRPMFEGNHPIQAQNIVPIQQQQVILVSNPIVQPRQIVPQSQIYYQHDSQSNTPFCPSTSILIQPNSSIKVTTDPARISINSLTPIKSYRLNSQQEFNNHCAPTIQQSNNKLEHTSQHVRQSLQFQRLDVSPLRRINNVITPNPSVTASPASYQIKQPQQISNKENNNVRMSVDFAQIKKSNSIFTSDQKKNFHLFPSFVTSQKVQANSFERNNTSSTLKQSNILFNYTPPKQHNTRAAQSSSSYASPLRFPEQQQQNSLSHLQQEQNYQSSQQRSKSVNQNTLLRSSSPLFSQLLTQAAQEPEIFDSSPTFKKQNLPKQENLTKDLKSIMLPIQFQINQTTPSFQITKRNQFPSSHSEVSMMQASLQEYKLLANNTNDKTPTKVDAATNTEAISQDSNKEKKSEKEEQQDREVPKQQSTTKQKNDHDYIKETMLSFERRLSNLTAISIELISKSRLTSNAETQKSKEDLDKNVKQSILAISTQDFPIVNANFRMEQLQQKLNEIQLSIDQNSFAAQQQIPEGNCNENLESKIFSNLNDSNQTINLIAKNNNQDNEQNKQLKQHEEEKQYSKQLINDRSIEMKKNELKESNQINGVSMVSQDLNSFVYVGLNHSEIQNKSGVSDKKPLPQEINQEQMNITLQSQTLRDMKQDESREISEPQNWKQIELNNSSIRKLNAASENQTLSQTIRSSHRALEEQMNRIQNGSEVTKALSNLIASAIAESDLFEDSHEVTMIRNELTILQEEQQISNEQELQHNQTQSSQTNNQNNNQSKQLSDHLEGNTSRIECKEQSQLQGVDELNKVEVVLQDKSGVINTQHLESNQLLSNCCQPMENDYYKSNFQTILNQLISNSGAGATAVPIAAEITETTDVSEQTQSIQSTGTQQIGSVSQPQQQEQNPNLQQNQQQPKELQQFNSLQSIGQTDNHSEQMETKSPNQSFNKISDVQQGLNESSAKAILESEDNTNDVQKNCSSDHNNSKYSNLIKQNETKIEQNSSNFAQQERNNLSEDDSEGYYDKLNQSDNTLMENETKIEEQEQNKPEKIGNQSINNEINSNLHQETLEDNNLNICEENNFAQQRAKEDDKDEAVIMDNKNQNISQPSSFDEGELDQFISDQNTNSQEEQIISINSQNNNDQKPDFVLEQTKNETSQFATQILVISVDQQEPIQQEEPSGSENGQLQDDHAVHSIETFFNQTTIPQSLSNTHDDNTDQTSQNQSIKLMYQNNDLTFNNQANVSLPTRILCNSLVEDSKVSQILVETSCESVGLTAQLNLTTIQQEIQTIEQQVNSNDSNELLPIPESERHEFKTHYSEFDSKNQLKQKCDWVKEGEQCCSSDSQVESQMIVENANNSKSVSKEQCDEGSSDSNSYTTHISEIEKKLTSEHALINSSLQYTRDLKNEVISLTRNQLSNNISSVSVSEPIKHDEQSVTDETSLKSDNKQQEYKPNQPRQHQVKKQSHQSLAEYLRRKSEVIGQIQQQQINDEFQSRRSNKSAIYNGGSSGLIEETRMTVIHWNSTASEPLANRSGGLVDSVRGNNYLKQQWGFEGLRFGGDKIRQKDSDQFEKDSRNSDISSLNGSILTLTDGERNLLEFPVLDMKCISDYFEEQLRNKKIKDSDSLVRSNDEKEREGLLKVLTNQYISQVSEKKKLYKKEYKQLKKRIKEAKNKEKCEKDQLSDEKSITLKDIKAKINFVEIKMNDIERKNFHSKNLEESIQNCVKYSLLISKGFAKIKSALKIANTKFVQENPI